MKDSLSEFIKSNREEFDNKVPSNKVWGIIEKESLDRKILNWNSVLVWRAAAMAFFCLSIYLLFTRPNPSAVANNNQSKDFSELETFYSSQIAEKVQFISENEADNEVDQFTQDFQKLDAMYQVLKEEMKIRPSNKVKDALVLNLLVRIDLLNQQIKKLEDRRKPRNTSI